MTFPSPGSVSRRAAVEAISLRQWAFERLLLLQCSGDAPDASATAWKVFLRQERCAALLAESLRTAPLSKPLPAFAATALNQFALAEMRHVLSARAHLQVLSRIAEEEGWRIVVLKGTADVAAGMNVPVMDVDVWCEGQTAQALCARLDRHGYTAAGKDVPGAWHLAPRTMGGMVNIEVHQGLIGFDEAGFTLERLQTIPQLPPLERLTPSEHAWSILCQAVLKHPDRRSRIRDLLMVRHSLDQCDTADRESLQQRIESSALGTEFTSMIAEACGDRCFADDARHAATFKHYVLLLRLPRFPAGTRRNGIKYRVASSAMTRQADEDVRSKSLTISPANVVRRLLRQLVKSCVPLISNMVTLDLRVLQSVTAANPRS